MLQAAANTAPIGVYVCGHTSTAAGLTVSQSFIVSLQTCMTHLHVRHKFMFKNASYCIAQL